MTAKWLGLPPWELADVPHDWLGAVSTVMYAEAAAERERAIMRERAAKRAAMTHGTRLG